MDAYGLSKISGSLTTHIKRDSDRNGNDKEKKKKKKKSSEKHLERKGKKNY